MLGEVPCEAVSLDIIYCARHDETTLKNAAKHIKAMPLCILMAESCNSANSPATGASAGFPEGL